MVKLDLKPELEDLIKVISTKNMYSGNKIPDSVMRLFEIEVRESGGGGVIVPYWIAVLQKGRGPRKSTTDHQLYLKIYEWMNKRNMFKSTTEEGKVREAKQLTWYLNKYGNKHFRSKVFIDIWETARKNFIEKVNKKFSDQISKITMSVI